MQEIIKTEKKPIKLWLSDLESAALNQAKNLANFPFTVSHVALMPDTHIGYGMPIGGVLATKGVVIPNAVGVDIGCGMCAVKTSLKHIERQQLLSVVGSAKSREKEGIRKTIPLGMKHHEKKQDSTFMPDMGPEPDRDLPIVFREYEHALTQIGTLGGGNHFIEIQKGNDGCIWLMIHSGSRNLGFQVAHHYKKMAREENKKSNTPVPEHWDLDFFHLDSDKGQAYLREMTFCVDFASANRRLMMERVKSAVLEVSPDVLFEEAIDVAHNYAALERHFNQDVMVHRKGATRARQGELGIIPGSQGTCSYIVRGKGNKESFYSCSHGAGRKLGRKQAQKVLDLEKEKELLDKQGVIHSMRRKRDLDEASGAYKDIRTVMHNQEDLVDIVVELWPLAVVKG